MDAELILKVDRVIELLSSISKSAIAAEKKAPKTSGADAFKAKLAADKKEKTGAPGKSDKPREVIKHDTLVEVDAYSDNAKKFWSELFDKYFKHDESKKKPAEDGGKTNWLKTLLTLLGGALLGIYTLFKEKIQPYLKLAWNAIKGSLKLLKSGFNKIVGLIKEAWIAIKEGKIGELFKKIGTAIKNFFGKLKTNIVKQLGKSKVGRFILRVFESIGEAFTKFGKSIMKVVKSFKSSKSVGVIGKIFKAIGKIFRAFAKGAKVGLKTGATVIKTIMRVLKMVFKAFGGVGKILCKLLPGIKMIGRVIGKLFVPLTILMAAWDVVSGLISTVQKEGLSFTSVLKGLAVGLIKMFTLGFLDSDKILGGLNTAIEKLSDWFVSIWEFITNIPKMGKKLLSNIPGIGRFFKEEKSNEEVLQDKLAAQQKRKGEKSKGAPATEKKAESDGSIKDPDTGEVYSKQDLEGKPKKVAQDFVSRPGKEPLYFTGKDTVFGAKSGGPIESLLAKSVEGSQQIGQSTSAAIAKQAALLEINNKLLNDILNVLSADGKKKGGTVVVSSQNNNLVMGGVMAPTKFRTNAAS